MRAAIYARRSTEEHQIASLDVQLEEAHRYIAAKGWILRPEHIFIDDAKSRAEFKKRPGLLAMLNAAESRAFDVVVARDETRIGGDTYRTGIVIQDLLDHGVRLFYHFTDEEVRLDGAVEKFLVAARSFASELEREKTAQRTHEHLMTKARRGLNVGGRVYGYDNIEVKDGERRVRVEYRVNPEQAEIVREIFRRYAAGEGLRAIVKELNGRRVPPPRAGRRGTGSWSPSAVWAMLRRDRYRGILIWGRQEKTYRQGTKVRVPRVESDWIRVEEAQLRIIDDDLWFAAHAQMRPTTREPGVKAGGRPPRYLLSGFSVCDQCGGPIAVSNAKVSYENVRVYGCTWHRNRGDTVCRNGLRRPVDTVNHALVDWLVTHVLSEDVVLEALREVRRRLAARAKATTTELPVIQKEAAQLRGEIARLVAALASTDQQPAPIVTAIAERQDRLSVLEARLRAAKAAPEAIQVEVRRMEAEVRQRLQEFRGMLDRNPEEARQVIRALLRGPLRFKPIEVPDGKRYRIEGEVSVAGILGGGERTAAEGSGTFTNSASPAGFEPA